MLSDSQLWKDGKYDEIEAIIKTNRGLHPIFQKWDHLSRNLQEHELMHALLTALRRFRNADLKGTEEDIFAEAFFSFILEPSSFYKTTEEGWIKAIKSDDYLRNYILRKLKSKIKMYQQFNSYAERLIKQLEMP